MSDLIVQPSAPLRGRVAVPGDKSISHRALLLGAIAEGTSQIENFLPASDCQATVGVLRALGVGIEELATTTLVVRGVGLTGLREPVDVLDCRRSGTTMRLLAGVLAGQPFFGVLTGDVQLRRRPMARIVEPLSQMGASILGRDGGRLPPLAIRGGNLRGLDYRMPVASAQVKSAILLAGLYADGPTIVQEPGPARDHTERMLLAMGAEIQERATLESASGADGWVPWRPRDQHSAGCAGGAYGWSSGRSLRILPGARLQSLDVKVPGDFSSAAFPVVAATLVEGSEITVEGVGLNPTRTGLLDALRAMGADIVVQNEHLVGGEPVGDLVVRASRLHGTEVGGDLVVRMIDELPILAVAATQAHGETVVRDAAELRVKETDRIATTVEELRHLGAEVEPLPDGFVVRGPSRLHAGIGPNRPIGAVDSHGDHRLAMALAVCGLIAENDVRVLDVACIADSFPGFEVALADLGGSIVCE